MISAAWASSSDLTSGRRSAHLGPVHGRVEDLAFLPTRAADQDAMGALGVVLGHTGGSLGRLVVGVGVNSQQTKSSSGIPYKIWGRPGQQFCRYEVAPAL